MHLIKLILQIFHLFLDRLLFIRLLIFLGSGSLGIRIDAGNFQIAVQDFFITAVACFAAVLCQQCILFFRFQRQPHAKSRNDLAFIGPLIHKAIHKLAPLEV